MFNNEFSEETLLTWYSTQKNIEKAFLWLKWKLFFKNRSCLFSFGAITLCLAGLVFLKFNYIGWSFEKSLLTVFICALVLVITYIAMTWNWEDLENKKLTKLDIEFFLKHLNSHSLKFFNAIWKNKDSLPQCQSMTYKLFLEPFKPLQDKVAQDKKLKKEVEEAKKSLTVTDIMELGGKMLVQSERQTGLLSKSGKKRLL